ncbi:MAG: oxidoreductase [Oceanococcus sp.]
MKKWTLEDLPNLKGKTAVVTGANSGLGLETSRALAGAGARVILTCRSQSKADGAMADIRGSHPDADLDFVPLDLASLDSVREAALALHGKTTQLDLLINNAGVMGLPLSQTADGFEMLFGTNHLGHFALTAQVMDLLEAAPAARVVSLASVAHKQGQLPLDDLNFENRSYSKPAAYAQSKLANISFALELDRRLKAAGSKVISVSSHPGYAATNVFYARDAQTSPLRAIWNAMAGFGAWFAQSSLQGSLPSLYAASMPDVQGGDYYGPHGLLEFWGYPVKVKPTARAQDAALGKGLWEKSVEMTGVNFL